MWKSPLWQLKIRNRKSIYECYRAAQHFHVRISTVIQMKEIQHQQLSPSAFNAKYHISPSSATTLLVLHTVGLVTECLESSARTSIIYKFRGFCSRAGGFTLEPWWNRLISQACAGVGWCRCTGGNRGPGGLTSRLFSCSQHSAPPCPPLPPPCTRVYVLLPCLVHVLPLALEPAKLACCLCRNTSTFQP